MKLQIEDVRAALALPDFDAIAAQEKMAPIPRKRRLAIQSSSKKFRLGAVMALLYCLDGDVSVVLTRRRDDMNNHAGQISFPGGRHDPPETLEETALREMDEEIGVPPTAVTMLGSLFPTYIPPSGYEVHPFVGWYHGEERPSFRLSVGEVAETLETPLTHLLNPQNLHEELWTMQGHEVDIPFFDVNGHKVWGATAMILNELLERLRAVKGLTIDD